MRWALLTCASLSVAAHALTVTLLPPVESPVRKHQRPTTWHMRMVPTTSTQESAPATEAVEPVAALTNHQQTEPISEQPTAWEAESETLTDATPPAAPPHEPVLAAAPLTPTPLHGEAGGDSEYIPRPELSFPPVPQAPVLLSAPSGHYETSRITGILSLYIDETGKVHHITSSETPMPPEFEEAARQAFMSLSFSPGVLDGTPVKSRIRIEVVFDNTPLPDPLPLQAVASAVH